MSTRSRIGLPLADGSILSVYCHWDGYPSYTGVQLQNRFKVRDQVAELIDGGDLSCVWTDSGFEIDEKLEEERPLYYSERGEDCPPILSKDFDTFLHDTKESWGEYAYLFTDIGWICYDVHEGGIEVPIKPREEIKTA